MFLPKPSDQFLQKQYDQSLPTNIWPGCITNRLINLYHQPITWPSHTINHFNRLYETNYLTRLHHKPSVKSIPTKNNNLTKTYQPPSNQAVRNQLSYQAKLQTIWSNYTSNQQLTKPYYEPSYQAVRNQLSDQATSQTIWSIYAINNLPIFFFFKRQHWPFNTINYHRPPPPTPDNSIPLTTYLCANATNQ